MAKKLPNELLNEIIRNLPLDRQKWISLSVSWVFNIFLGLYMTEHRQIYKDFGNFLRFVANNDARVRKNFASQMISCILDDYLEDENYQSNEWMRLFHALGKYISYETVSENNVQRAMLRDLLYGRATTNANDRGIYGKIRRGDAGAVGDARIDEFITPILRERVPETGEELIGKIKKLSNKGGNRDANKDAKLLNIVKTAAVHQVLHNLK